MIKQPNLLLVGLTLVLLSVSIACSEPAAQPKPVASVTPAPTPSPVASPAPKQKRYVLFFDGAKRRVKNPRYMPDDSVCVDLIIERREMCFKGGTGYVLVGE